MRVRREWRAAGPLGGIARPLIGFGGKRGAKTPLAEIALSGVDFDLKDRRTTVKSLLLADGQVAQF